VLCFVSGWDWEGVFLGWSLEGFEQVPVPLPPFPCVRVGEEKGGGPWIEWDRERERERDREREGVVHHDLSIHPSVQPVEKAMVTRQDVTHTTLKEDETTQGNPNGGTTMNV